MPRIKSRIVARNYSTPQFYDVLIYQSGNEYCAKYSDTGAVECVSKDASSVIQNAINKLSGGGTIVFKRGIYDITSEIKIPSTADPLIIDGGYARFNLYSNFLNFDNGANPIRAVVKNLRIRMETNNLVAINVFNYRSKFTNIQVYPVTDGSVVINIKRSFNNLFSNIWGGVPSGTGYVIKYINTVKPEGEGSSVLINVGVTAYGSAKGYLAYLVGNPPNYWVQYLTFINPFAYGTNAEFYIKDYFQRIVIIGIEAISMRIGGYHRGIHILGGGISNLYICTEDVGSCNTEMPVILDNVQWRNISIGSGRVWFRGSFDGVGTIGTPEKGVASIKAGTLSTTIYHSLRKTPTIVLVTPLAQPPGRLWVENITSSSFTVSTDVAPTTDLPFAWYAEV
jgi:hypothetical protein